MSTHNICFPGEIHVRKILCGYPLLSVAMLDRVNTTYVYILFTLLCVWTL